MNDFIWDLDGLVSLSELKLNISDVYLMIDNFKLSELYTRQNILFLSHEFTTTEDIFNLTGLYKISFSDDEIRLIGTTDLLNHYSDSNSMLAYEVEFTDDLNHFNFMNLSSILLDYNPFFPVAHLSYSDESDIKSLLSVEQVITVYDLCNTLILCKLFNLYNYFDLKLLLDVTSLREFNSSQSLYYLSLLSSYCNRIEICNLNLDINFNDKFIDLLYTYPNIVLSNKNLDISLGSTFSLDSIEVISYDYELNNLLSIYDNNKNPFTFHYLG